MAYVILDNILDEQQCEQHTNSGIDEEEEIVVFAIEPSGQGFMDELHRNFEENRGKAAGESHKKGQYQHHIPLGHLCCQMSERDSDESVCKPGIHYYPCNFRSNLAKIRKTSRNVNRKSVFEDRVASKSDAELAENLSVHLAEHDGGMYLTAAQFRELFKGQTAILVLDAQH